MRGPGRLARALLWVTAGIGIGIAAGFVLFAARITAASPPDDPRAEGIVVLTGGAARIDGALRLLVEGRAARLLISGVNPAVGPKDLAGTVDAGLDAKMACCVDLGRAAKDTIGNAAETRAWAISHGYHSLIVVTSAYHMPRSLAELSDAMPEIELIPYPVSSPELRLGDWWRDGQVLGFLLREYGKYLVAATRLRVAHSSASSNT
jgi:uncharacterized SAM-binding protein YcdF (DUF218 family)